MELECAAPEDRLPRRVLAAITGPAASGKSRAIEILGAALTGASIPGGVRLEGAEGLTRPILADRGALCGGMLAQGSRLRGGPRA